MKKLTIPLFLQFLGKWDKDSKSLWRIYSGLRTEIPTIQALAAAAEIEKASRIATNKALEKQQQKHAQEKMRYLRYRYGSNIPRRFTMTFEQRQQRLERLQEKRRSQNKQRKEKRELIHKRALAISRIRKKKG